MSNDLDNNSNRHFGAVLLAIAALSMLSVSCAGWIAKSIQPTHPASAQSGFTDADEWQVSLNQTLYSHPLP